MSSRRDNNVPPPEMDAAKVRLSENPDGTLKLAFGARLYKSVRVRIGRPLYKPDEFASVLDKKGAEIGTLVNLKAMPQVSRRILDVHHDRYDLTSVIYKINSLSHQYGSAFWDVQTDKGHRQFVIRGTSQHVRWLDDSRILVTDARGNRFEIPDLNKLDRRSRNLFHLIL